jgi:hypothetical protein
MTELIQILRTPPASAPVERPTPATPTVQWPAVAERLREYAAARDRRPAAERCEFCGAEIQPEHGHVVNVASRTLLCVCRPCFLLFTVDGAGGARFRAVPDRYQLLSESDIAGEAWDAWQIPIELAFFFRNSVTGRVTAFYPSPAGATESELPLDAWDDVVRRAPALATMVPDVEALLVRRRTAAAGRAAGDDGMTALVVPIDACYELVGRIRRGWRGFHGGDDVWREIDAFFDRLVVRARGGRPA